MTEIERRVCSAWNQASVELGIAFTTPFRAAAADGTIHEYLGLVHEFGGSKGTLICLFGSESPQPSPDLSGELYFSMLSDSYAAFERELFVDTLRDWGWFGTDKRPAWLKG